MSKRQLDPTSLDLRPLQEYCGRLPSRVPGRKLNRATLYRWALKGRSDGRYLRTVGLGSGRFTCDAWVSAFLAEAPAPVSLAERRAALDPIEKARIGESLGIQSTRRSA